MFIAAAFARVRPGFSHEPNKSIATKCHFISLR